LWAWKNLIARREKGAFSFLAETSHTQGFLLQFRFLLDNHFPKTKFPEKAHAMKDASLDETDRKILRILCSDGRISNQKLAEQVNLSPTPCWNRVRALESAGYITGYAAVLDQRAMGLPETVIIEVTLERHDDEIFQRFGDALALLPEVMEAYLLTGEYDYLIKVAVSGTEGYERFLRQKLYKIPGIRHSRSTFALRCLKRVHSVVP
jgi:Lrp/AsnC family leucine-responsive transcriptional regulator